MHTLTKVQPRHLIPIHPDNVASRDWTILLEANTVIGPPPERFRVARATRERSIIWRLRSFRMQPFLVVEGYDPRIHFLFFCPQLFRHDGDGRLVPLRGEEIGRFIAHALQDKAAGRRPWYAPAECVPVDPLIQEVLLNEYDTLLVEPPRQQALPRTVHSD